jgi:sugar lactone lactonase YvrE
MVRELEAGLVADVGAVLGEGPAWDGRRQELVWVDILAGTVHVHDAEGRRLGRYDTDGHVGSVLPADDGGWLLVTGDGFARLDRQGTLQPLLDVIADRPELRFNDAKCDPWGRALAGTMRYDETAGSASLYRLEATGVVDPARPAARPAGRPARWTARVLLDGLGLANGLGWSGDGGTMYFIDSLAGTVVSHRYEPEEPVLGERNVLVTLERAEGLPDGMCVDVSGCLWVAVYGGAAVKRFRPDGVLDTVVHLPVAKTTSVAFGGARGDRLFITTAGGNGRPDGSGRGGLWAVDPGTSGAPATLWRGGSRGATDE